MSSKVKKPKQKSAKDLFDAIRKPIAPPSKVFPSKKEKPQKYKYDYNLEQ